MRMLGTSIHVKVFVKRIAQFVAGEHTLHGILDHALRVLSQQLSRCSETLSARIAGVTNVFLFGHLLSGETDLLSVDNDHVIATIHVRSEVWLVFSTQQVGHA